jgi:hypothetical protein
VPGNLLSLDLMGKIVANLVSAFLNGGEEFGFFALVKGGLVPWRALGQKESATGGGLKRLVMDFIP